MLILSFLGDSDYLIRRNLEGFTLPGGSSERERNTFSAGYFSHNRDTMRGFRILTHLPKACWGSVYILSLLLDEGMENILDELAALMMQPIVQFEGR